MTTEYFKLGDILEQVKGPFRNAKEGKTEGEYPLLSSSKNRKLYLDSYDYEELALIIQTDGNPNVHLKEKFNISHSMKIYRSKNEDIMIQYVYYYLNRNLNIFEPFFKGTTIKCISKGDIENIEIPVPSLEVQIRIVEEMERVLIDSSNETVYDR